MRLQVFPTATQKQLEMRQRDPSPSKFAEKTIDYAEAKTAYFTALTAEVPELMSIAMGREARPPELDRFAGAFWVP